MPCPYRTVNFICLWHRGITAPTLPHLEYRTWLGHSTAWPLQEGPGCTEHVKPLCSVLSIRQQQYCGLVLQMTALGATYKHNILLLSGGT